MMSKLLKYLWVKLICELFNDHRYEFINRELEKGPAFKCSRCGKKTGEWVLMK